MRAVIFQTNTLLPLEAITTFGINAKPNSVNPFGFFGTGLKLAIAILVRTNHKVTFNIGTTAYIFTKKSREFRGKEFEHIQMQQVSKGIFKARIDLPFTTELGKHWDLWQAFRELESNTRDESGETSITDLPWENYLLSGVATIHVEGEDFVQEFFNRENVFLPDGESERTDTNKVQVIDRPSKHLYYRGVRVHTLEHPSLKTYNLLYPMELTEDRTLKQPYAADMWIREHIVRSTDREFIKQVLDCDKSTYEGNLQFNPIYDDNPSEEWRDAIRPSRNQLVSYANHSVAPYAMAIEPPKVEPKEPLTRSALVERLLLLIEQEQWNQIKELIFGNRIEFEKVLKSVRRTKAKPKADDS